MRHRDRIIGIALGILLGVAVVIIFVFYVSQETIDSPAIDENSPPAERSGKPGGGDRQRGP